MPETGSRAMGEMDDEADFAAIEATLRQSSRGRGFLDAVERRSRSRELATVLAAIDELRAGGPARAENDAAAAIADIAGALDRASAQIANLDPPPEDGPKYGPKDGPKTTLPSAGDLLRDQHQATSDILDAAEHVQEVAWTLRERGGDSTVCDLLDERATEVYTACARLDRDSRALAITLNAYRFIADKVDALRSTRTSGALNPFGAGRSGNEDRPRDPNTRPIDTSTDWPLPDPDPGAGAGMKFVSDDLDFAEPIEPDRRHLMVSDSAAAIGLREAFADIDAMPTREKLAFFS